jgi:site-specific recombinase XerD
VKDITIIAPREDVPAVPGMVNLSGATTDAQLLDLWLAGCRSEHTKKLYERVGIRLLNHLPHGLRGATVGDVARFEASLVYMQPKARHTMMAAARAFFRFAERTSYIPRSPAHIKPNRRPAISMRERCLSADECWRLIDHAGSERNRRVLAFLYGTGVRVSELTWLTWGREFWRGHGTDRTQFFTVLGKRDLYRDVPVPLFAQVPRPADALPDDAVFAVDVAGPHPRRAMAAQTVRNVVREAALMAGIKKAVSPHWFRHSACTHLQERGVPPLLVKELLGHASLDTTTGYSHGDFQGAPGNVLSKENRHDT